ncbi:MAG: YfhO family protein [Chloroflexi bacterium]|nr:YfhO family protein [Chloroflexota bacterium]
MAAGRVAMPCALALLLGVGLAAIFLLPALLETRYVNVAQWTSAYYDFRRHFVYFFQLFSPFWGFGYSDAGPGDAMSFQLGVVPFVLAILSLGTTFQVPSSKFHVSRLDNVKFIRHCEEHPFAGPERSEEPALSRSPERSEGTAKGLAKGGGCEERSKAISLVAQQRDCFAALAMTDATLLRRFTLPLFFQLTTVLTIFLMLAPAAPLWVATPLASFAQFPWRLLALTALSMAFLAGVVVAGVQEWRQRLAGLLVVPLLAVIVWGSWPYLWPQIIPPQEGPVSLAGLMRFQQSSGEMVGLTAWADIQAKPTWSPLADLYVAGKPVESKVAYSLLPAGMTVQTLRHRTILDEVRVTAAQGGKVTFYTQYYPGWRAYLDGREVPVMPEGDLGLMTVEVPAGEHVLLLRFEDTPVRVAGTVISLVAGLVVVAVWGWEVYRRRAILEKAVATDKHG